MKKTISFIVPCYNVECYVQQCIESIYHQGLNLDDFEVIAVNDGSTDNTLDILKKISYQNFRIINQENQGLSDARNNGLKVASGEIIWFIDSDDYIEPNSTQKLLDIFTRNNLDILLFGLTINKNGNLSISYHNELPTDIVIPGRQAILTGYKPNSVCGCILSKSFLTDFNLQFYSKLYHQDVQFMYRAMAFAKRIMSIKNAPYIYRINEGTISTSTNPAKILKRTIDDGIIAKSFFTFAKNFDDKPLSQRIIKQARAIVFGTIYNMHKSKSFTFSMKKEVIKRFRQLGIFPLKPTSTQPKHIIGALILNIIYCRIK